MMNRRTVLSLPFAALARPMFAQGPLQKVTINYPNRSGSNWPLFLAKDGGYYQKYGLDVNLVFGVHPAGIAMLVSGEGQMVNSSLEQLMQAASRDGSLVLVGSSLNRGMFALMANKRHPQHESPQGQAHRDRPDRRRALRLSHRPARQSRASASRDVEWIPVGTDVSGRAAALQSGRADATLLTAPAYFKVEEAGYKTLANLADHDDIFASTAYILKKSVVASDPALPEKLIKAHAEGIKRFYEDKAFAVKTFLTYDKNAQQSDMERVYDLYAKPNAFERVPYVLAGAVKSVIDQQPDPQIAAQMKAYDFHKVIDNSYVSKLVKEGFFEQLFGPSIKAEEQRKAKLAFGK